MASFAETAADIAVEAGALLRYYFERRVAFEMKGDYDLVTEADRGSEKLIVERLKQHFPPQLKEQVQFLLVRYCIQV